MKVHPRPRVCASHMNSTPAHASRVANLEAAREIGFGQCVRALRGVLMTTPVGWVFATWVAWNRAPHERIFEWLSIFFCAWLLACWLLAGMRHAPEQARHGMRLMLVAALDGLPWGSISWLLTGFNASLDPWLGALLCGVGAVNASIYSTYLRAYFVLIGSIWAMVMASALLHGHDIEPEMVLGLTIFFGLSAYYMRSIAQRALDGIRFQLTNAQLAEQLDTALQIVKQEASTDSLTGQPNRRALDVLLVAQLGLARLHGRPFSVLLLDIDHFKQINDVYGHGVGDDALRAFARRVSEHLRQGDTCARYGGEEFVVVLPATMLEGALDVAERLRRGVGDSSLLGAPAISATVSIGAAQHVVGESIEHLLQRVDTAVYAAKRGGRNQVCTPEPAAA